MLILHETAFRKVVRRQCLIFAATSLMLAIMSGSAFGKSPAWAEAAVATLESNEHLGHEWRFVMGGTDLSRPIRPGEWYALVAETFGVPADPVPDRESPQRIIWFYSGGLGLDQEGVISREWAVGGLVKLMSYYHDWRLEGDGQTERVVLKPFPDAPGEGSPNRSLWVDAIQQGLVKGYPNGELGSNRTLSVIEAAVLLARIIERYGIPPRRMEIWEAMQSSVELANPRPGDRVKVNLRGVPPQILERNHLFLHRIDGERSSLVSKIGAIPASGDLSLVLPSNLPLGKYRFTVGSMDEDGELAVNSGVAFVDFEVSGK